MRFNCRLRTQTFTLFFMGSTHQTLRGYASKVGQDQHVIMWDLENCTLDQAKKTLLNVQKKYALGEIYITGDREDSFRAWCFQIIPFKSFLKILLDTDYVDYQFFYWTVRRGKATLRTSTKKGRDPQTIVSVLKGVKYPVPDKMVAVKYDTGLIKRGLSLLIG